MSILQVARDTEAERARLERQAKYADDPVLWAREYMGINPWRAQREILYSIRDNRNTAVAAGHGVGKSFIAAVAVAWWMDTHPIDKTYVATTAPSSSQLGIIWDQLRKLHAEARRRFEKKIVDHPLPGYITGDNKWKTPLGVEIGEGRSPRVETIDAAFQGRHADYLFAIGDEAVGLTQGHLEALGNIATGPANRQLLLANPTNPACSMAALWDDSITTWNRMHISVFDSPAITPDPEFEITPDMALSGMDYVNQMKERWGKDHPIYIARVLGQWAVDADNLVFSAEQIANAKQTVVVPDPDILPEHGWDISADGPDYTVGYELRTGYVWETDDATGKPVKATDQVGYQVRLLKRWNKLPLVTMDPTKESSASRIHELAVSKAATMTKIDAAGIGKSIVNGLQSLDPEYEVVEYFGQRRAFDEDSYKSSRAELFFLLRDDMILGRIDLDPEDETLFNELAGIQYEETKDGRLAIETKQEMRKRGMKSPDFADACAYARYPREMIMAGLNALPTGTEVIVDPEDYVDDPLEYGSKGFVM